MYSTLLHFRLLNQFMTIAPPSCSASRSLIFVFNFAYSLFRGKIAGRNPWHSNTLEWTAPSPPPHGNFETTPIVRRGPYEYSVPDAPEDYLPQTAGASRGACRSRLRRTDPTTPEIASLARVCLFLRRNLSRAGCTPGPC